ncbi:hypothetical protein IGI04_039210 [Brassica rapa subsp. trilocularis]|uniref:F-box domain-containing protein n=2 Tax=Brassica campestris TaxID=3711 RepID=A0A3P6CDA5_BRACM|nr:hypothetical protein IGI04_039210 [Brassica rapa subsp. trilocularis]CAG7908839.1 unnamed protein product [Brassica rapa]VDD16647.1 unnamed protein product [Brassica rapa]
MDIREEETGDGERRIQSKEDGKFSELTLDLTLEILLRLPAKSAVRFRCVSKLWSSITTRPEFIRSFAIQSSKQPCLLACVDASLSGKRLFISLPQHVHPDESDYSYVDRLEHCEVNALVDDEPMSESVHGLVCFGNFNRIVVWNPSMRQHVTLPELEPRVRYIRSCLGYDPVSDKYKVLCISGKRCQDPLVFTLGPQESWRVTQNSPRHFPTNTMGRIGICINGHVYYQATIPYKVDNSYEEEKLLMSFDVRYEKFSTIEKPADPTLRNFLLNYEGKIAWGCTSFSSIRFWVWGEGEKQEWSLRNFILPFPGFRQRDPVFECLLELKGITHDTGEFIFATMHDAFYVLYYDPKRERAKWIEYEGIGDQEFWIRNGILRGTYYSVDWFPNHSESLMSLDNVPGLHGVLGRSGHPG